MANLSILGLYDYDPTIFDGLTLPTAADITDEADKVANPWVPDKQDFIGYLLMQAAELELVYSSAPVMSTMITVWSAAHSYEWKQLYNTMLYKYNPIWNKDGLWKETRDLDGKNDRTANLTTTDTRTYTALKDEHTVTNMTDTHTLTNLTNTQTGAVEHDVTGFDVNSYSPNTRENYNNLKNVGSGSESNTRNGTESNTRTGEDKNVQTVTGTDKYYTEDNGTITREESGNIGVTMTQEMIQRQREIVQFNLYDYIARQFIKQFCLMVY